MLHEWGFAPRLGPWSATLVARRAVGDSTARGGWLHRRRPVDDTTLTDGLDPGATYDYDTDTVMTTVSYSDDVSGVNASAVQVTFDGKAVSEVAGVTADVTSSSATVTTTETTDETETTTTSDDTGTTTVGPTTTESPTTDDEAGNGADDESGDSDTGDEDSGSSSGTIPRFTGVTAVAALLAAAALAARGRL
jgi:hypothetical protein